MAGGNAAWIVPVSSAQRAGDREATLAGLARHTTVTHRQAFIGQRQPPQLVVAMRIDAGLINHEVRHEVGEDLRQVAGEGGHVAIVVRAVGQAHIEAGAGFPDREVLFGMERQGENLLTPGGQARRAIALMHIEIDDQHPFRMAFGDQAVGGDGEIVEHAVPRAGIVQRMVAPGGGVGGVAMLAGELCCEPCAAIGVAHAAGDRSGDGKADPAFLVARNVGPENLIDVIGAMHRLEPDARHRLGRVFGDRRARCPKFLHHEEVFVEAEGAAFRRWGHIIGVMDDV